MIGRDKEKKTKTSKARIVGIIEEDLKLSHKSNGRMFYSTRVIVGREDPTKRDYVPITISDDRVTDNLKKGAVVEITGDIRTYKDIDVDGKRHSKTGIYVYDVNLVKLEKTVNEVILIGRVIKKPFYKVTAKGYHLTALSLIVERGFNFSDCINCYILEDARQLKEGDQIIIKGRMQSRHEEIINRIFYEVFIEDYRYK